MRPEDEAILYQPSDLKPWYGRRPDGLAPLTRAWFIAVMQPHSHDPHSGAPLRALTPPRTSVRSYAGIVVVMVSVGCLLIWASFALGAFR